MLERGNHTSDMLPDFVVKKKSPDNIFFFFFSLRIKFEPQKMSCIWHSAGTNVMQFFHGNLFIKQN